MKKQRRCLRCDKWILTTPEWRLCAHCRDTINRLACVDTMSQAQNLSSTRSVGTRHKHSSRAVGYSLQVNYK